MLTALASGDAMTASEIANAIGLGRASVSTTLSKLAHSGEVTKASRAYQLAGHAQAQTQTDAVQAQDGDGVRRTPLPAHPVAVGHAASATVRKPEPPAERTGAGRRRSESLSAGRLEAMLAERPVGVSAVALARQLGASDRWVLVVLRELEATGRIRREGSRRTSRWVAITDEERTAARAEELKGRRRRRRH